MEKFKHKSVFRRGAEDGLGFGIYLSLLFIFNAVAIDVPLLGSFALLMALAVPVYTYITLRKGFVQNGYFYTFSEVWTHGIVLFLCGTLIMAATMAAYMTWINPNFIYEQCQIAITAYRQIDEETIASGLELMMKEGALPSPLSMAWSMITFGVFSGSILSLILSPIIRHFRPKENNDDNGQTNQI